MPGEYPPKKELDRRRREDWAFSDQARRSETSGVVRGNDASRIAQREVPPPAPVVRLARALRKDPAELARQIPEDTLRRLKYPMHVSVTEDGKTVFKHDLGIVEGRRALVRL